MWPPGWLRTGLGVRTNLRLAHQHPTKPAGRSGAGRWESSEKHVFPVPQPGPPLTWHQLGSPETPEVEKYCGIGLTGNEGSSGRGLGCAPSLLLGVNSRHTLRVGHRFPLQAPDGCSQGPWGSCEWKSSWSRALLLQRPCLLSASWPPHSEADFLGGTLTQADLVSWGPHKCPDFTSFFPQTTCFSKKYK